MGSDRSRAIRLARVARRRNSRKSLAGASPKTVDKGGGSRVAVILSGFSLSMSIFSLAVSIFYQYYREQLTLVAFTQIQESSQPNQWTVHFALSNPGNRTILVEDLHLVLIKGTISSKPNCVDVNVLKQYKYLLLNPAFNLEQRGGALIAGQTSILSARSIQVARVARNMFAIDSSNVQTAEAAIEIRKEEWSDYGTLINVCPVYRYAEPSGVVWDSICEGWSLTAIAGGGATRPRIWSGEPHGAVFLLPAKKDRQCVTLGLRDY